MGVIVDHLRTRPEHAIISDLHRTHAENHRAIDQAIISDKTFCINDESIQSERLDEVNEAVWHFLEGYFPTPSAFEI